MDKLASAATSFQLRLAGILMDTWIFFLFVAIAGITPGYLKTLLNAFGPVETICLRALLLRWQGIALPESSLFQILLVGKFTTGRECDFYKFLAIACGFLGKNLFETMIYVCELLTDEPEGGSAMIPLRTFLRLYGYLAELDCSGECVCEFVQEDAEELFRPCGPVSVSDESSTIDSSLYRVPSADVEEQPRQEEDTSQDVCGASPSESRSSDILQVLKDYGIDGRHSEIDEVHQQQPLPPQEVEIEAEPIDRFEQQRTSELLEVSEVEKPETQESDNSRSPVDQDYSPDIRPDDADNAFYDDIVDDFSIDFDAEEAEAETVSYEQIDDYEPIGLESILQGICECLEPVREPERIPTPPPPDPFQEFLKRMKNEVDEGCLKMLFRVPGIGPPISENRVTAVGLWVTECSLRQEGMVGPRNIRHFLCPDLDDHRDDDDND